MDHALNISTSAISHNDLPILTTLAGIYIILLGGILMPLFLTAARVCLRFATLAACVIAKAAEAALKPVLKQFRRLVILVATAGAALSILVAVIALPTHAQAPLDKSQAAVTKSIERMIGVLDKVAKNPVVQGAKVIARGYTAVKVYRLSKEVKGLKTDIAALNISVHAILSEVTGIIERIELGEALTVAELDAVNARIHVHALQIAAAEAEIEVLKLRMEEAERKARQIERQQREQDIRQRAVEHQQREAAARQRETDARVAAQQKRQGRDSTTPNLYFDPKCNCRRDSRERDTGKDQITAAAAK